MIPQSCMLSLIHFTFLNNNSINRYRHALSKKKHEKHNLNAFFELQFQFYLKDRLKLIRIDRIINFPK